MSLRRDWIASPNYSSRSGAVRLLIVHTAEGATNYRDLGNYFANPNAGVSSHVGIDDQPGVIGEYVNPDHTAWTAGNVNGYSDQVELCAFAAWGRAEWLAHPVMLSNLQLWLAEEAARFGIPLVKSTSHGVCGHVDVSGPGGHWDPGPDFPWDIILAGTAPVVPPTPATTAGDTNMVLTDDTTGGVWVADPTGAVYAYDRAPYLGGANTKTVNPAGYPCVGIAAYVDNKGDGYCLVLDWGDADGDGHSADGGDRYRRYRFPRDGSGRT